MSPADYALSGELKAQYGDGVPVDSKTLTTAASAWRDALRTPKTEDGEYVRLAVTLDDRPFPWREFRNLGLTDDDRLALAKQRADDIAPDLDKLQVALEAIGGRVVQRYWIVPMVEADVPRDQIATISYWSVRSADRIGTRELLGGYHTGLQTRDYGGASNLLSAGYDASQGNRFSANPVRVGIQDGPPQWGHYGFKNANGTTRIKSMKYCTTPNGCAPNTPYYWDGVFHATTVTQIAAGSIEGGQDSGITDATERRKRSGIAPKADIHEYWSDTGANNVLAIEQAVLDGIAVQNHSYSLGTGYGACDPATDLNGINAALRAAADAGLLNVFAAGNNGGTSCKVVYPGLRRDGITVGALNNLDTAQVYSSTQMSAVSSYGGGLIYINGVGYSNNISYVDLVASGTPETFYNYTGGYPGYQLWDHVNFPDGFTSYAAPVVTGQTALAIHGFYVQSLYSLATDPRLMTPYMMMLGDGWSSYYNARTTAGLDRRSGAGRTYVHTMSSASLVAPWNFACHKGTLSNGGTLTYNVGTSAPESTSIKTWKLVLTWDEPDYTNAADLDVKVYDACPPGGGSTLVASDTSRDLRGRIRLTSGSIGNKCLQYSIEGYYIPPGETRTFSVCQYYQSGNTTDH